MHRPSALPLLAYRFLGWRLGPAYRQWVHHDITSRGWLLRQGTPALAGVLVVGGALTALLDGDSGRLESVIVVVALAGLGFRKTLKERALMQQGIDASGQPLPDLKWYADDDLRVKRSLLSATGTVVLTVGGMVILALGSR